MRCKKCGDCNGQSLGKTQSSVYHCLLTASGLAFGFDYPEDDSVGAHTIPNTPIGWRWDDGFMSDIMGFAGLSFIRFKNKTVAEIREIIKDSIDTGYPAMAANNSVYPNEMAFKLIQQSDVQNELKRLFKIVFDNDRAVAGGIMEILNAVRN